MNTTLLILTTTWIGSLSLSFSNTIIRRHDRADERYLALGKEYGSSVCSVGGAVGTLIGSRWMVTAAHVASNISPFSRSVICGGVSIPIASVYSFPAWLQAVAAVDPFAYAVHGFRAVLLKDVGVAAIAGDLAFLGAFSAACIGGVLLLFPRRL